MIIIQQLSDEEFKGILTEVVKEQLNEFASHQKQVDTLPEYLTRREVASYFRISLVTLHNWVKSGKLQSYKINGRIRFKRSEIIAALEQVKNLKYKREGSL